MRTLILLTLMILIILGCSTEGDIKFINRTRHNLYFSVKGNDYILEGATDEMIAEEKGTSKSISVDTGKEFLFWGADTKKVDIELEGETFLIGDTITTTTVEVKPNETTRIFTDPTHASVKVINNSEQNVSDLFYFTDYDGTMVYLGSDIPSGEIFFKQIPFATNDDVFFYTFVVEFSDSLGLEQQFFGGPGDPDAFLEIDEQYLIELLNIP